MGGPQAAGVLTTVKQDGLKFKGQKEMSEAEIAKFQKPILDKYETEGSAYYSTARIWDDGVILPEQTRDYLAMGLSVSYNEKFDETKFGVFRM